MDEKKIIASALSDYELARAFSELVAERWDNWDLSVFLPYLVDTCAASVLPYLADQFDIEGLRGFAMAMDETQQRNIIKKSIALHKFIGTPWAIREACRTIGFPIILLEEGVTATPGGAESAEDWARFRVLVDADMNRHITVEESQKMRLFVEFYKNERSHLVELGFYQSFAEQLPKPKENLEIMFLAMTPNPVWLSGIGTTQTVSVHSNVDWVIDRHVFEWADGTGGQLKMDFTGNAGHTEIKITSDFYAQPQKPPEQAYSFDYSDAYVFPQGSDNRTMIIKIQSTSGNPLGTLIVIQRPGENNAYSRAYSNDYNLFDHNPYITVTPAEIWLPTDPDQSIQLQIESNTNWTIE